MLLIKVRFKGVKSFNMYKNISQETFLSIGFGWHEKTVLIYLL